MPKTILHDEHLPLGATMAEGADGYLAPRAYASTDEPAAFAAGVALCDLTGLGARIIEGERSAAFSSAAFAGRELEVGEVAPEAVLTGDGALASAVLLARTGGQEYACWDLLGRGDVLGAWLGFMAGVERGGQAPFAGVTVGDAAGALVPLLLWGPQAPSVLGDYLHGQALPAPGTVRNLALDAIGCLVASVALDDKPCYLVLVPPASARVLWRSLLSFTVVTPVGHDALTHHVGEALACVAPLAAGGDRLAVPAADLKAAGLVRDEPTYVGARALLSNPS